MSYVKTVWDETVGVNPARLNNLETQYEKALADSVPQNYDGNAAMQTIFVGPGQAFTTIQAALNSLKKVNAGIRDIILTAGTTFDEQVQIKGFHGGGITVRGSGNVNLNGGIDVSDNSADISLQSITITNDNMFNLQNSGYVYAYELKKLVAGVQGILMAKGKFNLSSCQFSNQSVEALSAFSGAVVQLSSVTGTGNAVALSANGSIIMKDTGSTLTGTTPQSKSNGGQIF